MTSEYPATGELAAHPTGAEHAVLLRGVLLYGEGEKQDVLIQEGVIAEIGADLAGSAPQGAEVLDLDGQWHGDQLRRCRCPADRGVEPGNRGRARAHGGAVHPASWGRGLGAHGPDR